MSPPTPTATESPGRFCSVRPARDDLPPPLHRVGPLWRWGRMRHGSAPSAGPGAGASPWRSCRQKAPESPRAAGRRPRRTARARSGSDCLTRFLHNPQFATFARVRGRERTLLNFTIQSYLRQNIVLSAAVIGKTSGATARNGIARLGYGRRSCKLETESIVWRQAGTCARPND